MAHPSSDPLSTGRGPLALLAPPPEERLMRALVEHSPEAILLLDADAVVVYANQATATVFGYTPEEARGCRVIDWLRPDDAPGFADLFEVCLKRPGQLILVSGFYRHKGSDDILYGEGRLSKIG